VDDAAILRLMSEAIVNTQNPNVTVAMCVQGNTQADLQGTPIRACQLAWSARKTAIPVAFGDLPLLVNGTYSRVRQWKETGRHLCAVCYCCLLLFTAAFVPFTATSLSIRFRGCVYMH